MHSIVSIDYITKSVHPFVYPSGPKTLLIIPDQGEEFKWRILSQIGWLQFVIDKALGGTLSSFGILHALDISRPYIMR